MSKVIVLPGGGFIMGAFATGVLAECYEDNPNFFDDVTIVECNSYGCVVAEVFAKSDDPLKTMRKLLSSKRENYRTDWWGLIRGNNIAKWTPLQSNLKSLPNRSRFPRVYYAIDAIENRIKPMTPNHLSAAYSCSIDGIFPRGEGRYIDLASEARPPITVKAGSDYYVITAYNDQAKRGESIMDRIGDQISRPLANLTQQWADEIKVEVNSNGNNFYYFEAENTKYGVNDWGRNAADELISHGRKIKWKVLG